MDSSIAMIDLLIFIFNFIFIVITVVLLDYQFDSVLGMDEGQICVSHIRR